MQVEVVMSVDVVERQTGGAKRRELRVDLRGELATHPRASEYVDADLHQVSAQPPIPIHEIRDALGRQRRKPVDQYQVQTDPQGRQAARHGDRLGRGASAHHQAGGRENAALMRDLDGLIDLRRKAEVVGRDDQRYQCGASRRSRRNWKNSMPSRSRRFIISGLLAISPTIDAILLLRK